MDSINKIYNSIYQLEQIKRTGWLMNNVPSKRLESVSDHTLQVIVLAVTFVHQFNLNYDISKLVQMCFIHDIGESLVGDVSDIDIDFENRKKLEREKTIEFLSSLTSNLSIYLDLWKESEERETDMSKFLYQVDKLDAIIKAKKYSIEYNKPELFEEFYNTQLNKKTFDESPLKDIFYNLKIEDNIV